MKTYALATLGCKVNQYEGDRIKARLTGLVNLPFGQTADLYIINTCSVTAEAEAKARQLISRARRAAPQAVVVLTGCWPPTQTDNFRALGVDLFFDNAAKADMVKSLPVNSSRQLDNAADGVFGRVSRTRAFIKVQDGCDQFCAYCAVPFYRGTLSSRPIDEVVAEIDDMVKAGNHEMVLTGIHLGKYGVDLDESRCLLVDLIRAILDKTELPRLRLSSIEPREVTDKLIDSMAGESRLAAHLHIPLQSGSDRLLSAMNRNYSAGEFLDLVEKARRRLPDIGLTTDVMVGFPGESEDDFQATIDAVKAAAFSRLHVFRYSARPGTPAAMLPGQIKPAEKKARAADVKYLGAKLAADFASSFIGREVSVLVERERRGERLGLTSQYVRVRFEQASDKLDSIADAVGIKTEADVLTVRKSNG